MSWHGLGSTNDGFQPLRYTACQNARTTRSPTPGAHSDRTRRRVADFAGLGAWSSRSALTSLTTIIVPLRLQAGGDRCGQR